MVLGGDNKWQLMSRGKMFLKNVTHLNEFLSFGTHLNGFSMLLFLKDLT